MNKIIAIARKELTAYFKSPIAYIILIVTISVFNVFFYLIIDNNQEATLRDVFRVMEFMFIFIIPLLTMKTFAEEKSSGTMEFLMTTPTNNTEIVLGKYLGSSVFFSVLIALTFVYFGIIEFYATPDRVANLVGYLGIWLEGMMFIAIGLLISSLTRNQVIAAICTYVILFLLYFSISLAQYVPKTVLAVLRYCSTLMHTENFASGLITLSDLVYFVSTILFCVVLTRISIENRLWR